VADWSARCRSCCSATRARVPRAPPGWAGGKLNATTLALQPLSADEIDRLIANLLGGTDLGATIVARISEAAEGNPLFVEQLLAMLADQGVLRSEGGRWTTSGEVTLVVVPPSIRHCSAHGSMRSAASSAGCSSRRRRGRTFHVGTVAALTDLPRPRSRRP